MAQGAGGGGTGSGRGTAGALPGSGQGGRAGAVAGRASRAERVGHGVPAGARAVRSGARGGGAARRRAVYLLDLSARETAVAPVALEIADAGPGSPNFLVPGSNGEPASAGNGTHAYGYVRLTRFAAQATHAPARLLSSLPGVVRVPVERDPVALVRGGAVEAAPLVAWRAGGLYVTAVLLRNTTAEPQTLDPRGVAGAVARGDLPAPPAACGGERGRPHGGVSGFRATVLRVLAVDTGWLLRGPIDCCRCSAARCC